MFTQPSIGTLMVSECERGSHFEELKREAAVLAALQPEPPADVGRRPLQIDGDESLPVRAKVGVDVPREDGVLRRVDDGLYRLQKRREKTSHDRAQGDKVKIHMSYCWGGFAKSPFPKNAIKSDNHVTPLGNL